MTIWPRLGIDAPVWTTPLQQPRLALGAYRGYLLVPEDQAAEKQAELAAIAEQKRQQEAAAAAPPLKPRKPMAKPTGGPAT
jgi:hypothetical protein